VWYVMGYSQQCLSLYIRVLRAAAAPENKLLNVRVAVIARTTGTLHTSAKTRLTSVIIWISPSKFNHLFTGQLPTFPENFMQIRSKVFCTKLLADRQTDNVDYISSLAEVIKEFGLYCCTLIHLVPNSTTARNKTQTKCNMRLSSCTTL